jgi:hypothetical protein
VVFVGLDQLGEIDADLGLKGCIAIKDAKAQRDFLVFYRENTPPSP